MRFLKAAGIVIAALLLPSCDGDVSAPNMSQPQSIAKFSSGKSASISLTNATVIEGQTAQLTLSLSGGNGKGATVSWKTSDGKQMGTITNLRVGSPQKINITTLDDTAINGSRTLGVTATIVAGGGGTAIGTVTINDNDVPPAPSPMVTCPDGTMVPTGTDCPVVTPPPPTPAPDAGWEPSPSLHGKPDIPSEFNPLSVLTSGFAIPGSTNGADVSAFRFQCGPGQVNRDDAIVYPGQHGKSHLHDYFGNLSANGDSTYESLRASGQSTCQNPSILAVNRSAYWTTALLDGKGNVVRPDISTIYYKRWPKDSYHCGANGGFLTTFWVVGKACVNIPNGLKFVFGYNMLNPGQAPTGAVQFLCSEQLVNFETLTQALNRCRALGLPKTHLIARIEAPACWDGKNLDSPDHRSHVSYQRYSLRDDGMDGWGFPRCDADHPYVIPTFTLTIQYQILSTDDTTKWHYSSDEMMPGVAPGTTFHADFFAAWDPIVEKIWSDNCIDGGLDASAGNLCNGYGLPGGHTAWYLINGIWQTTPTWENPNRLQPIPPALMGM